MVEEVEGRSRAPTIKEAVAELKRPSGKNWNPSTTSRREATYKITTGQPIEGRRRQRKEASSKELLSGQDCRLWLEGCY